MHQLHNENQIGLLLAIALAAAVLLLPSNLAVSAELLRFPDKPIRLIVPFSPGGGTDFMARVVGQKLTERWGQQVVVDNRSGASGTIGTNIVAKSQPDGYTLVMVSTDFAIVPNIHRNMPYSVKELAPITQASTQTYILVLHPSVPANSVKELIVAIRSKKGGFNFGTAHWSTGHLTGELFKLRAGVEMTHIPYKGAGPAIIDLVGGQISLMFAPVLPVQPHLRSGKLRAIAVTAAQRSSLLPELPTLAEAGFPGLEATGWHGFLAPAKTPKAILEQLHSGIVQALNMPDVQQKFASSGFQTVGGSPAAFATLIAKDMAKWANVIKDGKLQLDN